MMLLEEIMAEEGFNLSPHNHAFINPYDGCSMGCPFCYWLSREGWEGRIQVKMNIGNLLEEELRRWPKREFLYLGSVCDPFNELEGRYRLTKRCLEIIKKYEVPLVITSSAVNPVILDYVELLRSMKQRVVVVVELARIPYIEAQKRGEGHAGITHANQLCRAGLEVWATLAPLLPGITDLEQVLEALDVRIPVYVDSLHCSSNSIQGTRVMEWIKKDYPEFSDRYQKMIAEQDDRYFRETLKNSRENSRVRTFPFQLEEV